MTPESIGGEPKPLPQDAACAPKKDTSMSKVNGGINGPTNGTSTAAIKETKSNDIKSPINAVENSTNGEDKGDEINQRKEGARNGDNTDIHQEGRKENPVVKKINGHTEPKSAVHSTGGDSKSSGALNGRGNHIQRPSSDCSVPPAVDETSMPACPVADNEIKEDNGKSNVNGQPPNELESSQSTELNDISMSPEKNSKHTVELTKETDKLTTPSGPAYAEGNALDSINKLSNHTRSWHLEILYGMFLDCEEEEINDLAHITQTQDPSLTLPRPRKRKRPGLEVNFGGSINNFHLHPNKRPSLFPIFSETIRRFKIERLNDIQSICNEAGLLNQQFSNIGDRYRRKSYTGRSIKHLERAVMSKFRERVICQKNVSHSIYGTEYQSQVQSHSQLPYNNRSQARIHKIDGQIHKPISLVYNECSLQAISNWALPPSATNNTQVEETETTKSPQNDVKSAAVKKNVNLKRVSCQQTASSTFRECKACRKYGHYEVECEQLVQKRARKNVQMSKWLCREVRVQNVLREFASPFATSLNSNVDDISDDSDDEAVNRLDVAQDLDLLQKRKEKLANYNFIDVESKVIDVEKSAQSNTSSQKVSKKTNTLTKISTNAKGPSYDGCEICRSKYQAEELLVCDGCDKLYHKQCLTPPLEKVPEGDWFCPACCSYDSDVSSVVEIEGLDDFVIEQRKLKPEEKLTSNWEKNMRVVCNDSDWNASLSIVPKDSCFYEELNILSPENDESVVTKQQDIDVDRKDIEFSVGELCFAKRSASFAKRNASPAHMKGVFARDIFWPAIVLKIQDSNIGFDGTIQTKYIVKFFALTGSGRVRASHILPFFPFYEKLGHNKLKQRHADWYPYFRRALEESVSGLGISSLSQALVQAREITRTQNKEGSRPSDESNSGNLGNSKELFEHADVTEIENFIIIANPEKGNQDDSELPTSKATLSASTSNLEDENNTEEHCTTEELIGGIASFFLPGQNKLYVGVLSGVDKARRKVLVRIIPNLVNMIKTSDSQVHENSIDGGTDDKLMDIFSCKIGSSLWIPIEAIIHMNGSLKKEEQHLCSSLVEDTLVNVRNGMRSERDLSFKILEDRMVKMDSSVRSGFDKSSNIEETMNGTSSKSNSSTESDCDLSSYFSEYSEEMSLSSSQSLHEDAIGDNEHNKDSDEIMSEPPSPRKKGSGTIFTVEMILDDRINKQGVKEYLIKWKGFNDEENTWEIEKNILDTNVLRKYLAQKLLKKLSVTAEAKDNATITSRTIKVIKAGMHLMDTILTITPSRGRKNRCPFCFADFGHSGIAPHLRLHSKSDNYDLIKQVTKIADVDWYKVYEKKL